MDSLVKKAYENWNHVIEYDGKSFMNFKQNKRSRNEVQTGQIDFSNALTHQVQLQRLPAPVPTEPSSVHSGQSVGGKYGIEN